MKKNAAKPKIQPVYAWAWVIQDLHGNWILCRWSSATKKQLENEGRPSPEARPVRVKMQVVE